MQDLPLFYAPDVEKTGLLPEEEAGHALRVLRLTEGEAILLTNGRGRLWQATISDINKKGCAVVLGEDLPWQAYWQGNITLCVAPTKSMDRMEWLLEKAVEIGVNRIILLKVKHSERKHINVERLMKILVGAMKQSQKALLPELITDVMLDKVYDLLAGSELLIMHCRDAMEGVRERVLPHKAYRGGSDVALLIGPEGDFTIDEVVEAEKRGAKGVCLGESRLRTETAAMVALQWVHTLQLIEN